MMFMHKVEEKEKKRLDKWKEDLKNYGKD